MMDPIHTEQKLVDGELIIVHKYEDGSRSETNIETGDITEYYPDGTVIKIDDVENRDIKYPDGRTRQIIGDFEQETLSNGIINRYWYGHLSETVLPDGTITTFYANKKVRTKKLPDGSQTGWFEDGTKRFEKLPDGTHRAWYPNGKLEYEKLPNGTQKAWYSNGNLHYEIIYDNDKNKRYYTQYSETGEISFSDNYDKQVAIKRVAQKQAEKSARKGKTQHKLSPFQKAFEMHLALRRINKR